jgi:hypothetical protein
MNISAGAAYILARPSPPIGAEIEVRVAVPGVVPGAPSKSQMRGRGTVIRVMPDKGFVAKVTFHVVKTVEAANLGPSTGPS